jgi:hypothetical protein
MLSSKLYTSIYKYMNYSFIKKYIPVYTSIWFSSELYTSTYHHMTVHDCSRKVWNCIYVYTLCSNDSIPAAPARLARPKAVNSTLPLEWRTIHGHTSSSTMVFISSHPFLSPPAPHPPLRRLGRGRGGIGPGFVPDISIGRRGGRRPSGRITIGRERCPWRGGSGVWRTSSGWHL